MADSDDLAPAVESILATARRRGSDGDGRGGGEPGTDGDRIDVAARSLTEAFQAAADDDRVPIIAEVKPTSPTTDGERTDDPVTLAESMVDGGAAALSVLTEPEHFGGSPECLTRVREAVDVPVLRKDFLLQDAQLDAVAADVVLLIARFLDEAGADDLETMLAAARERGFQALVEVHTEAELRRAVEAGADVVGVNNRDLAKLEVDLATFEGVAPHAPENVTLIAESGITTPDDVRRMRRAGADALLVGSAIMDGDVEANTRRLATASTTDATDGD